MLAVIVEVERIVFLSRYIGRTINSVVEIMAFSKAMVLGACRDDASQCISHSCGLVY